MKARKSLSPEKILVMTQKALDREFTDTAMLGLGLKYLQRNARLVVRNRTT